MEAEWGVALAQLSGKASCLQQLMAQTKRKCHQPDGEFLQDIQDTIDRCQSYLVGHVESASPRLQGKLRTLLEKTASVRCIVDSYKGEGPSQEGLGIWGPQEEPQEFWGVLGPPAPLPTGGSWGSQAQSSSIQPLAG
ncbi:Zinc finger protein RFP, partial [Ophiophagus hannah]